MAHKSVNGNTTDCTKNHKRAFTILSLLAILFVCSFFCFWFQETKIPIKLGVVNLVGKQKKTKKKQMRKNAFGKGIWNGVVGLAKLVA